MIPRILKNNKPQTKEVQISERPKQILPLDYPQYSNLIEEYISGYCISQILYILCSLKIPDVIGSEQLTLNNICERIYIDVNKKALYRILNAAKAYDILEIIKQGEIYLYILTGIGSVLQTGTAENRKVLHFVQPDLWDASSFLEMYVRNEIETPPFDYTTQHSTSEIVDLFLSYIETVEHSIDINSLLYYVCDNQTTIQCGASGILLEKIRFRFPNIITKFISQHEKQSNHFSTISELEKCDTFICMGVFSQHNDNAANILVQKCYNFVDTLLIIDIVLNPPEYQTSDIDKNAGMIFLKHHVSTITELSNMIDTSNKSWHNF